TGGPDFGDVGAAGLGGEDVVVAGDAGVHAVLEPVPAFLDQPGCEDDGLVAHRGAAGGHVIAFALLVAGVVVPGVPLTTGGERVADDDLAGGLRSGHGQLHDNGIAGADGASQGNIARLPASVDVPLPLALEVFAGDGEAAGARGEVF